MESCIGRDASCMHGVGEGFRERLRGDLPLEAVTEGDGASGVPAARVLTSAAAAAVDEAEELASGDRLKVCQGWPDLAVPRLLWQRRLLRAARE